MKMKYITNILHCIRFNKHEPNYNLTIKRSNQDRDRTHRKTEVGVEIDPEGISNTKVIRAK